MSNDPLDFISGSIDNIYFACGEYLSVFKSFLIILQEIHTMSDETAFQALSRAMRDYVLIETGKDMSEELQSVLNLDETSKGLRKLVEEGHGTSQLQEILSDMASVVKYDYINRLTQTIFLQSQAEKVDQPSKGLPKEIQPVVKRLKLFIKRACHAKEDVDNIMKVIHNTVRFQISIMRMMHPSLKESGVYI